MNMNNGGYPYKRCACVLSLGLRTDTNIYTVLSLVKRRDYVKIECNFI